MQRPDEKGHQHKHPDRTAGHRQPLPIPALAAGRLLAGHRSSDGRTRGRRHLGHHPPAIGPQPGDAPGLSGLLPGAAGDLKVLGAAALLIPRRALLKEWAYAGAFFTYTGAIVSHLTTGYARSEVGALTVMTALTMVSWALRPPGRRRPPHPGRPASDPGARAPGRRAV